MNTVGVATLERTSGTNWGLRNHEPGLSKSRTRSTSFVSGFLANRTLSTNKGSRTGLVKKLVPPHTLSLCHTLKVFGDTTFFANPGSRSLARDEASQKSRSGFCFSVPLIRSFRYPGSYPGFAQKLPHRRSTPAFNGSSQIIPSLLIADDQRRRS